MEDLEGLRSKLRGAVKKGKAIDKARAELEDTVAMLRADLEVTLFSYCSIQAC